MVYTVITKSVNILYMGADNELAVAITKEMQRRNVSVREAARIIGVSHPTLMKALAGDRITFEFADSLSKFLRTSTEHVLRLGGLLPKIDPKEQFFEQILHKIKTLSEEDQQHLMNFIDFLLSK